MRMCLNEEMLQRFFDGELFGPRMEDAASHLAGCPACSAALNELQDEASLVTEALAPEFESVVPTERLRTRIDAAIGGLHLVRPAPSSTSWLGAWLSSLMSLTPQRAVGYAVLVVALAFVTFLGVARWRGVQQPNRDVAVGPPSVVTPVAPPGQLDEKASPNVVQDLENNQPPKKFVERHRRVSPRVDPGAEQVARVQLLPGERSYLKTIAALDSTIKSEQRTMRPALQAEYERNLALVDRAIATTRTAAKRNPNDPDAADFMFAAYQSKVDLLNTIADARVYNRPH